MEVFYEDRWEIVDDFIDDECQRLHINAIIFSHDFAKTFWGECKNPDGGPLCITHNQDIRDCITWEDHLQKMVLEKEPLKYLEKFLN